MTPEENEKACAELAYWFGGEWHHDRALLADHHFAGFGSAVTEAFFLGGRPERWGGLACYGDDCSMVVAESVSDLAQKLLAANLARVQELSAELERCRRTAALIRTTASPAESADPQASPANPSGQG